MTLDLVEVDDPEIFQTNSEREQDKQYHKTKHEGEI
jgi:hypothetical protein